jgi:hypothetical protein
MDEEMDEGEDHMKGMLYTIYSFILHQQRLRAQEQLQAGASSLPACRLASSPPPPPALCSPTSPVDWDRLRQPVSFDLQYSTPHFKDTVPKIRNKCSQERKCAASVPIFTFMYVPVSDLFLMYVFSFSYFYTVVVETNFHRTHECGKSMLYKN